MISKAHRICNFPTQNNISGFELTKKLVNHLNELGGNIKQEKVESIRQENESFVIKTNKKEYLTQKVILTIGTQKRKLNIPGEEKFLGKGVSYCAICDAGFFRNKTVAVAGGSDAALTSALLLAEYAEKVYIIYRKEKFLRAEPAWISQVEKNKKIKPIFNANIKEIVGKEKVEKIKLDNGIYLNVDGIFIEIGSIPDETLSKNLGLKTERGYIEVNKKQETNIQGIYAAGDITNSTLKQVITACSEGATAANSVFEELKKNG